MEYGSIERDIHVDASPEGVFEVISRPEHMRGWWPDDARFEPVAGAPGELQWREHASAWDHYIPALGAYVARLVAAS